MGKITSNEEEVKNKIKEDNRRWENHKCVNTFKK